MKQYVLSKKSRGYRGGPPPAYDFNNKPLLFDNLKDAIKAKKEMDFRNPVGYEIFVYVPEFQKNYLKPIKIKESTTPEQKLRKIIRSEISKNLNEGNNTVDPKILETINLILIWSEWMLDKNRNNSNNSVPKYIEMTEDALKRIKSEYNKIK